MERSGRQASNGDLLMDPLGKEGRVSAGGARPEAQALPRPRRLPRASARTLPRHLAADALRRRMLACADALALLFALALLVEVGTLTVAAAFWTASLLPV